MENSNAYAHHISSILKVLVYIEEHLETELSLEKLAKIAAISPFHFHRLFRTYMGETLSEYIKRLRIQRAQERLQYSEEPITNIAFEIGYETPSAFTKVFNQLLGTSPREYRKVMRPLLQKIIERTLPTGRTLKPKIVRLEEETILFVRRVGDYKETPNAAFERLEQFLQKHAVPDKAIKGFYSIALDDPHIVERGRCRFDAAVSLRIPIKPEGEVGLRSLPAGRYALFEHLGPTSGIESAFEEIFLLWYPSSQEELANSPSICKHIAMQEKGIPEEKRLTELYIPLEEV